MANNDRSADPGWAKRYATRKWQAGLRRDNELLECCGHRSGGHRGLEMACVECECIVHPERVQCSWCDGLGHATKDCPQR